MPTGEAAYRERVLIAWARSGAAPDDPAWRDRFALPERWQPPRFPLGGADVMALGVAAGPRVGEILRALEDLVDRRRLRRRRERRCAPSSGDLARS